MEKQKEKRKGKVGRVLNFTPGDVEANRAGFISHNQRKRLLRLCFVSQEFFWYTGFSLYLLGSSIAVLNTSMNIWGRLIYSSIVGFLALLIVYGPLWIGHLQPYFDDLRSRKVRRVLLTAGQNYYKVGTSRYHIPYWQQDVLNPNHDYWLYITPSVYTSGPIILSLEVVTQHS